MFTRKEFSCTTEAGGDFVEDEKESVASAQFSRFA